MKLILLLSVILFSSLCLTLKNEENYNALTGIEFLPNFLPKNVSGRKYCPTEDIWRWKKSVRDNSFHFGAIASCKTEGKCDEYEERNTWTAGGIKIPLYVTVLCQSEGNCAGGVNQVRVNDQVRQINEDYANTGIQFEIQATEFKVSQYYSISAYNPLISTWFSQLVSLKNTFAVDPKKYLNVFITEQKSGLFGTLLGIGTFPCNNKKKKKIFFF